MTKKRDINKLPKWAREKLYSLEVKVRGYEARIDGEQRIEGGMYLTPLLTPKEQRTKNEFAASLTGAKAVDPPMLVPDDIATRNKT